MSPKAPRVTASQAIRVVEEVGFVFARQSGSHAIYRNSAGMRVTVPCHGSRILHPKVLASILTDAGLSVEQFVQLLSD